jgi:tRNA (mo5U34)-methyltransferase
MTRPISDQGLPGRGATSRRHLERRIADLGPWFHNLDLDGVQTAPDHFLGDHPRSKFAGFSDCIPADLTSWSVLDIGCNAGFHSFEMKRRGADRVVAVDHDPRYLAQARLASEVLDLEIEFRQLEVYDLGALGETFDLVLFLGVLYHLRHPLLALDLIHDKVARDMLVFQSLQRGSDEIHEVPDDAPFAERGMFEAPGYPTLHFVENAYAQDPTNWWIPNHAASEAMLRSAGFRIETRATSDTFICRRTETRAGGALPCG